MSRQVANMERRWVYMLGILHLLIHKTFIAPSRTYRLASQSTSDEAEKVLSTSPSNTGVVENTSATHSIVRPVRHALLRATSIAMATMLLAMWYFPGNWLLSALDIDTASIVPNIAPHHIAYTPKPPLLEVFQIFSPVLTVARDGDLEITGDTSNEGTEFLGSDQSVCEKVLAVHSFGFSYGKPFIGDYTPPRCNFNKVTWNLTVVSAGRQFDRLGIVYLGDIEVFRTSTAEPTANGIRWTYLKDMTSYLSLFKQDQKLIFDLGNLVNDIYTAAFNVTLKATFFTAIDSETPAELIIPVSKRSASGNMPSVFTPINDTAANSLTVPRNTKKAVFTIAATGQFEEEFWWGNVPQSQTHTFPQAGALPGLSPFREVQLFIDGSLAGIAWPFPIIFTGGVVPGLWRPIVGIDAFDMKEDEIDITPWLPLLCDGNAHTFEIRVSGLNDGGNGTASLSETTGSYWIVTGKIFIWLDVEGHITTGQGPYQAIPAPNFQVMSSVGKSANGTNETLLYQVMAQRSLSYKSTINLSHGTQSVFWHQERNFSNSGNISDGGNVAINTQKTTGYDISSSGYARKINYDLYVSSVYETLGTNISIVATANRGKDVQTIGQAVFPTGLEAFTDGPAVHGAYEDFQGSLLSTTQNGTATYLANRTSSTSFSYGTTEQEMSLLGLQVGRTRDANVFPLIDESEELFRRHAVAVNGTVIIDEKTTMGKTVHLAHEHGGEGNNFCITDQSRMYASRYSDESKAM